MITFDIPSMMSTVTLNLEGLGCVSIYAVVVVIGLIQVAKLIKYRMEMWDV